MKLFKLFQNKERKRALKILSEAQTEIMKLTAKKDKCKKNFVEHWHWENLIDKQKAIEKICLKIIN